MSFNSYPELSAIHQTKVALYPCEYPASFGVCSVSSNNVSQRTGNVSADLLGLFGLFCLLINNSGCRGTKVYICVWIVVQRMNMKLFVICTVTVLR